MVERVRHLVLVELTSVKLGSILPKLGLLSVRIVHWVKQVQQEQRTVHLTNVPKVFIRAHNPEFLALRVRVGLIKTLWEQPLNLNANSALLTPIHPPLV